MKKIFKILIPLPVFLTLPCIAACSQKVAAKPRVEYLNGRAHFLNEVTFTTIYYKEEFTFTYTLVDQAFVDLNKSYLTIGYNKYKLDGKDLPLKQEGNKFTFTVSSDKVISGDIVLYIDTYREFLVDKSQTSTEDFTFDERFLPKPIELRNYEVGFIVKDGRMLDVDATEIKIGDRVLKTTEYYTYETTIDGKIYDFIKISGYLVSGNISLKLVATDSVKVNVTTYPEYRTDAKSKVKKGADFKCTFTFLTSGTMLDAEKAIIKINNVVLDKTDYTLDTKYNFLEIKGEKMIGDLSIDVQTIECFTLNSHVPGLDQTVEVDGEKIIKEHEYVFKIWGINGKEILWDNDESYLLIDDVQYKKGNKWTVSEKDPETGKYTITVDSSVTTADIYCHFIVQ